MRLRAKVGPALYSVMEPGDEIVAGTYARTGGPWWVDMVALLAFLIATTTVLSSYGWMSLHPALPVIAAVCLLMAGLGLLQLRRKRVFMAVTRRQLVRYRLKVPGDPDRPMFVVPLPTARVTAAQPACPALRLRNRAAAANPDRAAAACHPLDVLVTRPVARMRTNATTYSPVRVTRSRSG